MGRKIDVVQKFTGIQKPGQNWWADWIFCGIFSQDSPHCSSATKFKTDCWDWVKHQIILQDELSSCWCSTTSHGVRKTTRKNARQILNSSLSLQRNSEQDNGHSLDLDLTRNGKWYSISEDSKQNEGDKMAEKMMVTLAENGHPVFRATSLLSRGMLKRKGGGKLSINCCADLDTITTVFRAIISVTQLNLYGAIPEMCEECESCHTGRPIVGKQSSSSWIMMTNILWTDDPAQKELLLQRYGERIEKLSQQDKIEQILYGCRIPDCCWSRTVFHDERHWWIVTIHRFSGLSWARLFKRRKFIWTKRLDSREHQNWVRIRSYNLLPAR